MRVDPLQANVLNAGQRRAASDGADERIHQRFIPFNFRFDLTIRKAFDSSF